MADRWDSSLYDDRHSFVWKAGAGLLELLEAKPGERILDLGCGTGHLTVKIAEAGAEVLGLDSSLSMVAQARQNYPKLKFQLADAKEFTVAEPVHAVFSNAVLHWIQEPKAVIARVAAALQPGGRFVLEFGAKHNIERIRTTLEAALLRRGVEAKNPWYYPSLAEYGTLLEEHGFEIRYAATFPRFTKLEHPERGLREWIEMFCGSYLALLPAAEHGALFSEIEEALRQELHRDGYWHADYRRLRMVAERA